MTKTVVFDPPGQCIYCGSKIPPFSKEHIIPRSLGGIWIFRKAVCGKCKKLTEVIDRSLARDTYLTYRAQSGLPSYNKGTLPQEVSISVQMPDGTEQAFAVPVSEYPLIAVGCQYPPPGILVGRPPSNSNPEFQLVRAQARNPSIPAAAMRPLASDDSVTTGGGSLDWSAFNRAIAKMAHGFAVAFNGADAYRALLPDLILGRCDTYCHFIGGAELQPADPKSQHTVSMEVVWPDKDARHPVAYFLVCLGLFRNLGLPIYRVVAGAIDDSDAFLDQGFNRWKKLGLSVLT